MRISYHTLTLLANQGFADAHWACQLYNPGYVVETRGAEIFSRKRKPGEVLAVRLPNPLAASKTQLYWYAKHYAEHAI